VKRFIILLTLVLPIVATASTEELFSTWGTVILSGKIANSKVLYQIDSAAWASDNPKSTHTPGFDIHSLVTHTGLGYQLTDSNKVFVGYGFQTGDQPYGKTQIDEHRAWQQHEYKHNFASDMLSFRSRLEERTVDISNDTSIRFREQVKLTHTLNKKWSLIASDEYFVNVNNSNWGPVNGFDQNRGFVGVGYKFNDNYRTEIGYMNQYINRVNNYDRMGHILSISLYGDVFK
jgi:hypothetical protein